MTEIEIFNLPVEAGKPLKGKMIGNNLRFEFNDIGSGIPGMYYNYKEEKIFIVGTVNVVYLDDDVIEKTIAYNVGKAADRFFLLDTNVILEKDKDYNRNKTTSTLKGLYYSILNGFKYFKSSYS